MIPVGGMSTVTMLDAKHAQSLNACRNAAFKSRLRASTCFLTFFAKLPLLPPCALPKNSICSVAVVGKVIIKVVAKVVAKAVPKVLAKAVPKVVAKAFPKTVLKVIPKVVPKMVLKAVAKVVAKVVARVVAKVFPLSYLRCDSAPTCTDVI